MRVGALAVVMAVAAPSSAAVMLPLQPAAMTQPDLLCATNPSACHPLAHVQLRSLKPAAAAHRERSLPGMAVAGIAGLLVVLFASGRRRRGLPEVVS